MMPVTLTIKQVPDELAARLRALAARNHRSVQGELMHTLQSILMSDDERRVSEDISPVYAVSEQFARTGSDKRPSPASEPVVDDLLKRLLAIAGRQGIDTTQLLTREQIHDRALARQTDPDIARDAYFTQHRTTQTTAKDVFGIWQDRPVDGVTWQNELRSEW
jgi:plasmid stability protein